MKVALENKISNGLLKYVVTAHPYYLVQCKKYVNIEDINFASKKEGKINRMWIANSNYVLRF